MKTIIFTQGNNIDGATCIALAKMAFGLDTEVVLTNQETINDDFIERFSIESLYDDDEEIDSYNIIGNEEIKKFDKIFITDACITDELLRKFGRAANVNTKLKFFDHHEYAVKKGAANYWLNGTVKVKDEGKLCSSTTLFYEYLKKAKLLEENEKLKKLTELVRICDTEQDLPEEAKNLQLLFDGVSLDEYVFRMLYKISTDEKFDFNERELEIIEKQRALKQEEELGEE